jgi:hypothetical protein
VEQAPAAPTSSAQSSAPAVKNYNSKDVLRLCVASSNQDVREMATLIKDNDVALIMKCLEKDTEWGCAHFAAASASGKKMLELLYKNHFIMSHSSQDDRVLDDINFASGTTCLHVAAALGHVDSAEFLLSHSGLDFISHKGWDELTAQQLAAKHNTGAQAAAMQKVFKQRIQALKAEKTASKQGAAAAGSSATCKSYYAQEIPQLDPKSCIIITDGRTCMMQLQHARVAGFPEYSGAYFIRQIHSSKALAGIQILFEHLIKQHGKHSLLLQVGENMKKEHMALCRASGFQLVSAVDGSQDLYMRIGATPAARQSQRQPDWEVFSKLAIPQPVTD